jgi:hypothetical protein
MATKYSSLLVTCPGAYADSGLGTGGFVLLHEGRAHVIDRADTTGIWESDGLVYRFSRGLHTVTAIDAEGARLVLRLPGARDVHDLAVVNGEVICVCSGTNEVLWFDLQGRPLRRWTAQGEGDAWHLNCLWFVDGRMYLCAFGEFATHRAWAEGCKETGFVFDLETGERVMEGLSGPHNPRFIDGHWVVCDSHTRSVLRQGSDGSARRAQLSAFTRGLAFDARHLYVGESADRKAATADAGATVAVLDRADLTVLDRIPVPFPEIYELLVVPGDWAEAIASAPQRYTFDPASEHIEALEAQVRRGEEEARVWRERAERATNTLLHRVLRRLRGGER